MRLARLVYGLGLAALAAALGLTVGCLVVFNVDDIIRELVP